MSTLTVVRHAQARPFEEDSDRLSEAGELQARALFDYWSRSAVAFDEIWCGTLERHRQTAQLALGRSPQISGDWNEYDVAGILKTRPATFPDNRAFQTHFQPMMEQWLAGLSEGAEPWIAFRERILRALRAIQQGPSNRSVALFTSGGPIGVLVQTALHAPDRSFLEINWRVRNCSITEFVFSRDRFSLDSFNAIPHLTDPKLRTFR
jgi:broad specificity phosphatase PhoE